MAAISAAHGTGPHEYPGNCPAPVSNGKAKYPQNIVDKIREKNPAVQAVDALSIAIDCGNNKVSNVVMVGMLARKLNFPKDLWLEVLAARVPAKLLPVNLKAFERGFECS